MKHLLAGICLLATFGSFAAETPPPDKVLPSDTLGVITIPDYTKAMALFKQANYGGLWNDAALKPFREKFMGKFKSEIVQPLERDFGIQFADYAQLAQGQVTLALMPAGAEEKTGEQPVNFAVIVDARSKSDVLKTNLASLKQKWIDSGKKSRPEKIRDIDFTAFLVSSEDVSKSLEKTFPKDKDEDGEKKEEKPPRKFEYFVGQSDSLLIVGTSAKGIEKILVRQAGGGVPSLSEQSTFAPRYGSIFRDAPVYGWLNVKAVVAEMTKRGKTEPKVPQPGLLGPGGIEKLLGTLGITAIETVSMSMQQNADGGLGNFFVHIPESSRKGLTRILSHQAKDAEPPAFVPADAVKFFRWRLDLQKGWTSLEAMVSDINPQYSTMLKTMMDLAGKDKDPNFDLRKQLIGNLGDDLISYQKVPRNQTLQDLASPPSIFLLSSPRAEELASAIKAVSSFLPQQGTRMKERDFLGRKIYTMAMSSPTPDGKRQERSLHYAASGGYVGFSFDSGMLEEYLRGSPAKALRDAPGFKDAAQRVGGMGSGLFGYENQAETSRAAFETWKKESATLGNIIGESALAGRLGVNDDGEKFKEWFDFSLLPSWDKIAKYFHTTVWSGALNADGLAIKGFAPTPPGMK